MQWKVACFPQLAIFLFFLSQAVQDGRETNITVVIIKHLSWRESFKMKTFTEQSMKTLSSTLLLYTTVNLEAECFHVDSERNTVLCANSCLHKLQHIGIELSLWCQSLDICDKSFRISLLTEYSSRLLCVLLLISQLPFMMNWCIWPKGFRNRILGLHWCHCVKQVTLTWGNPISILITQSTFRHFSKPAFRRLGKHEVIDSIICREEKSGPAAISSFKKNVLVCYEIFKQALSLRKLPSIFRGLICFEECSVIRLIFTVSSGFLGRGCQLTEFHPNTPLVDPIFPSWLAQEEKILSASETNWFIVISLFVSVEQTIAPDADVTKTEDLSFPLKSMLYWRTYLDIQIFLKAPQHILHIC